MATEAQLLVSGGDAHGLGRREGLATVGFKLDTLFASIRASIDSHGRVATLVEERVAQGMALNLAGEIDFGRGNGGVGKVGIGFTMEMM
jgi:mitochondrial import receptor subunit TOM40